MANRGKNIQNPSKYFNGDKKESHILLTKFIDDHRGKEVPINKVFDSTHKESIKKAREALLPL